MKNIDSDHFRQFLIPVLRPKKGFLKINFWPAFKNSFQITRWRLMKIWNITDIKPTENFFTGIYGTEMNGKFTKYFWIRHLLFSHFLGSVVETLYPSLQAHTAWSSFFVQTCSHPPLSHLSHGWITKSVKKIIIIGVGCMKKKNKI